MKIKICGIKDPEMALFAAKAGADLIGIMQHPQSSRYISPKRAIEIAEAARVGGAEPILVFVDTTQEEVIALCEEIGVFFVQSYAQTLELPPYYRRMYVNQVAPNKLDYQLIDFSHGKGKLFDATLIPQRESRCFLAGGLTPENVSTMINSYHPYGVDVSSGVEKEQKKDKGLIRKFIENARSI